MAKRILFICGSLNQTTQMHQISEHLSDFNQAFTTYYTNGMLDLARRLGLLEFTILGHKLAARCRGYLQSHNLPVDQRGASGPYDLVLTCSDVLIPKNLHPEKTVLVQEGITDPEELGFRLHKQFKALPRWVAGTAATGTSDHYKAFCVASEGYRELFARKGARREKIVVTGIPNFDNCAKYLDNNFPHRNYVLVCTSPLREILRGEDRKAFILAAVRIAAGRRLIFKFHPTENMARAEREVQQYAPGALVYTSGSAEEMIANCDALITRYSSTIFVGLALEKETYSDFPMHELRALLPVQNKSAPQNIAEVCRRVLEGQAIHG